MPFLKLVQRALMAVLLIVILTGFQGGCSYPMCVVEGTQILTPEGAMPVESITAGDVVLTLGSSGHVESGIVQAVLAATASRYLRLAFSDGQELRVTGEHPVRTPQGWRKAKTLKPGALVRKSEGMVELMTTERVRDRVKVFDLDVEPNSNYFANGVLVHNKSIRPPPKPEDIWGEWMSLWGGSLYFWTLNKDGTGQWARTGLTGRDDSSAWVRTGEVSHWELIGYDISITMLEPHEETPRETRFVGRAYASHMSGSFDSSDCSSDETVVIYRAAKIEGILKAFRVAVADDKVISKRRMAVYWIPSHNVSSRKGDQGVGESPAIYVTGYDGVSVLRVTDLATDTVQFKFNEYAPPSSGYYRKLPDLPHGTYRVDLLVDEKVVESTTFAVER